MARLKVAQNPSARFKRIPFTRTRVHDSMKLKFLLRNGARVAHISTSEIPKADTHIHTDTLSVLLLVSLFVPFRTLFPTIPHPFS